MADATSLKTIVLWFNAFTPVLLNFFSTLPGNVAQSHTFLAQSGAIAVLRMGLVLNHPHPR